MSDFLHKHNSDNVHARAVIVGLINLLNNKIYFENVLSDTDIATVYVPFFYNMGGDERFLQDYFTDWNECVHPKFADGNYDVIPRGIATLTSRAIDSGKLTHRFVRGNYVKEVNGQLQTFSAFINSLPINMVFEFEVETDTVLDAFKIEQALMETLYDNQVFSVTYRGFRIPCQAGFSDDFGVEKTFEFSYQSNERIKLKFTVDVETYLPVIDSTTERSNAKRIAGFSTVELSSEEYNRPRFTFTQPTAGDKYFSGGVMPIVWGYTGPMQRVNLWYRLYGDSTWRLIVRNVINTGHYDWNIPFFNTNGVVIQNEGHRASVVPVGNSIGTDAKIRAIIDASGGVDQIVIFSGGHGYSAIDTINVSLHPYPTVVPVGFVQPVIQANIESGTVKSTTINSAGSGFTPSPITQIEIKIEDSNDETVFNILSNKATLSGNTDTSTVNSYITNLSPTVTELLLTNTLIGQTVSGIGVPTNATIVDASPVLNRIEISTNTNATRTGEIYTLSNANGVIYIQ